MPEEPPALPQYSLPLGTVIGRTLQIWLRNFVPFTLLCALVMAPAFALQFLAPPQPEDFLGLALSTLVSMTLSFLLMGALAYGTIQQLRGEPASTLDALTHGVQTLGRVFLTGLLVTLRVTLMMCLCFVPGIFEAARLFVAIPAAAIEPAGGTGPIARSLALTKGSRWQTCGAWFLTTMLPGMALSVYVVASMDFRNPDAFQPSPWLTTIFGLLTTPVQAIAPSVAYFMLRQGKENAEPDSIAATFS